MMRLLLAEHHGAARVRLLAGSIFFMYGSNVSYVFNGRQSDLSSRPNDLIHWHAIHEACRERFQLYDFGEAAGDQQGLIRYKTKWGAQPRQLHRYYFPAPRASTFAGPRTTALPLAAVWSRLPLKTTAFLGALLWRYL